MIQSLLFLYKHPYNKRYPFFALKRFIEWKIIKLFKFKNYKKTIWNNRKIYLNYDSFQSMWIMYNWLVDWEEFNLIKDFVTGDSWCIDVGANMGFYTIWLSKFTDNILSFEPNPRNFRRLNQNISANNATDQIRAYNIAVGEVNADVRFTTNLDGENHISIHNSEENSTVVCKRLETILSDNKIEQVAYLKIDVEGFEFEVLRGLGRYIENRKIHIIQIEINKSISNSGSTVEQLLEYIFANELQLCSYSVLEKKLKIVQYQKERENYFLVFDLKAINQILAHS